MRNFKIFPYKGLTLCRDSGIMVVLVDIDYRGGVCGREVTVRWIIILRQIKPLGRKPLIIAKIIGEIMTI